MKYPTLDGLDVSGQTVFVRVDFNVSLNDQGEILDDSRIKASLPTLKELLDKGAKLVLGSHLGRPNGKNNKTYSLLPVASHLAGLLNCEVLFPDSCVGMDVQKLVKDAKAEQIILLENLRFHPGEEANDAEFSRQLANLADVYVSDAFGTLHRAHASTVGMVKYFQKKAIGRLVEKECLYLGRILHEPQKPFVVVLGGAKVSDKISVIENLMKVADKILIGGGMAYTFLKAQGVNVGESLVEESKLSYARRILEKAKNKDIEVILPVDSLVASGFSADTSFETLDNIDDWGKGQALDIGPKTCEHFSAILKTAKTVFWNGPMGVYEFAAFQSGTKAIAKAIATTECLSVVGGGDSLAAIHRTGYADQISHLSTGGGASLKFLEGTELEGLKVFL